LKNFLYDDEKVQSSEEQKKNGNKLKNNGCELSGDDQNEPR